MSVATSILLKRLGDMNLDFGVWGIYKDIKNNTLEPEKKFTILINDLKSLDNHIYDFPWCKNHSKDLGDDVTTADFTALLNELCDMISDEIENICHNPIFTEPTKFGSNPPLTNEPLVCYTTGKIDTEELKHDGYTYTIVNTLVEDAEYYRIYAHQIERKVG